MRQKYLVVGYLPIVISTGCPFVSWAPPISPQGVRAGSLEELLFRARNVPALRRLRGLGWAYGV